jgi:hypothetical protein
VSDPKPEPRRWTRVTNPVTPTVVTFSGGDSANAKPFVRLSNPVTPTVVTFPRAPVLFITLRGGREADNHYLPTIAALLIREVSRLEQAHGGHGLEFDRDGSIEEPGRLVLRLYPRLIDGEAASRVRRVGEELTCLARESREDLVRAQDADLRTRIADLGKTELTRAISGVVDMSVEVAA